LAIRGERNPQRRKIELVQLFQFAATHDASLSCYVDRGQHYSPGCLSQNLPVSF
jgi:hypothetical protein